MTTSTNNPFIPDLDQREKALDPKESFIVQAPAGSGKTELLMQRFLKLLSLVENPEEIIAITFTRKAAGEMQNRIIKALLDAKDGKTPEAAHEQRSLSLASEVLERDKGLGWGLLNNPGRLKIQTIDSLCASITRQMPILSGFGSRPGISGNPQELYKKAAQRIAEKVEDDGPEGECVRKALDHLDNSVKGLVERLVLMLGKRDQWLRHMPEGIGGQELKALLEDSYAKAVEASLEKIIKAFPCGLEKEFSEIARFAAGNVEDGNTLRALLNMKGLPGPSANDLEEWKAIREFLLTRSGTWRKKLDRNCGFPAVKEFSGYKKRFAELVAQLDKAGLEKTVSDIALLPSPEFSKDDWEILGALLLLLPIAGKELQKVFAENGAVDFQSVSMAAVNALGAQDDPTDLMLSLDMRIKHILVDEYQDTSRAQLEFLKALTRGWEEGDGRTLFVVGDPMQSIYLFREAEVGLFLEAKNSGIGNIRLTPLTLSANFRSQRGLLDWINASFKDAFPSQEDMLTGAISYSPSAAIKQGEAGNVQITLFDGPDDSREARQVISVIKELPKDEGVAILARSRAHFARILKTLRKEGIRFRAEELEPLFETAVVRDLASILRSLEHPYDRVAWLSVLRSPLCGLKLDDLHALVKLDKNSSVFELMNDVSRMALLSKDGQERAGKIYGAFEKALELKGRVPARELIEGLWALLGGPAFYNSQQELEDAQAFLDMVDGVSAGGWLDPQKDLDERIGALYSAAYSGDDAKVDVMTIHKAKGLEFDNVILPGLGKYIKQPEKKLLSWLETGYGLLLAPIDKKFSQENSCMYGFLDSIHCEKSRIEDARAFYVAATRAKNRLFLSGHVKIDGDEMKLDKRSFLNSIAHALLPGMVAEAGPSPSQDEDKVKKPFIKRLPLGWRLPEPAPAIEYAKENRRSEEIKPEFDWAGAGVKHLGTATHKYLCRIATEGLGSWDERRIQGEKDRLAAILRQLGISKDDSMKLAKQGIAILSKAIKSDKGRWILSAHEDSLVEAPFTAVVNNETIHVIIDRTFIDKDNIRWVIDYKTGYHEGGSLGEFLENEKQRYSRQLEIYEKALKAAGEIRTIKKGLYYPALDGWVEF